MVQVLNGETSHALTPASPGGDVIVGNDFADDAAVVRVGPGLAQVLTADIIAPIVDDPATFGRIAAANALSDVYAMGGVPRFALNLAFFPDDVLPLDVLSAILAGAAETTAAAGCAIVGGHTVRDLELKFGLSVTGEVDPDRIWTNRGAKPGDALVLTKALGTGILGTAIKRGTATEPEIEAAARSMSELSDGAMVAATSAAVTAATDVTGFGLLGHLTNILHGSNLAATLEMRALPALPGALDHIAKGDVPAGSHANLEHLKPQLVTNGQASEQLTMLAADAQTSGGLLLCVPEHQAEKLATTIGAPACVIGQLHAPTKATPTGTITLAF